LDGDASLGVVVADLQVEGVVELPLDLFG